MNSAVTALQAKVWNGSLPLEIRLAAADCRSYDDSEPYLVHLSRLSYLAFILPHLHAFFRSSLINPDVNIHDAWLSFENVPLKWHYPLGLLYDLYSGAEPFDVDSNSDHRNDGDQLRESGQPESSSIPWRLIVHYSEYPDTQLVQLDADGRAMHDMFINTAKEADYVRNGTARAVMSLSKEDSDKLWLSVQSQDLALFNSVNHKLLQPPGLELRHIPIRIYLPATADSETTAAIPEEAPAGHLRIVQTLVPLSLSTRQPQTLGTALNTILPSVFPSRRLPVYARPVLHGAAVPLAAKMEDLGRATAYPDGFLHVAVVMHG